MGSECRFNIYPNDDDVIRGISLLGDFISRLNVNTKSRKRDNISGVIDNVLWKLSDEYYVFLVGLENS